MGCHAWLSCVSGKSVYADCPAELLTPRGELLTGDYDGYGCIGGVDLFFLAACDFDVAQARMADRTSAAYQKRRLAAITIECDTGLGLRIFRAGECDRSIPFEDHISSEPCPFQGLFDPDEDLERDLRQWPTHQILRKSSDDRQTRAGTR